MCLHDNSAIFVMSSTFVDFDVNAYCILMVSLLHIKRLIYCLFYLQVPVDYTWANEILDHELPGLFKRRKSQSGSETVSSAIFKLCFPLCITFVSLFRCSMPLMSCFWILGQGISKALAKAAPVPLNGGVQSSQWGQHVLRVFEHLMEFDSQQDRLDEMVSYCIMQVALWILNFFVKFSSPFLKVSVC